MRKRLLLVGGTAGSGKTTVAQTLAHDLGAGWLQLDTVWIALKAAAVPGSPELEVLDVAGRIADENSDEQVLAEVVAAGEAVCRVLPDVFAFELDTHSVMVADGGWLLPSFITGLRLPDTEVRCVFLQHADVEGVAAALAPRLEGRAPRERHHRANLRIWQYGAWVSVEARARDLPVLDPVPFTTLLDRVKAVLTGNA